MDWNWFCVWVLVSFFALLFISYAISRTARYFIRIVLMYLTIFANAWICMFIAFPASFYGEASTVVFKSMRRLARWTGIKVEVRRMGEIYGSQTTPCVVLCNHQSVLDTMMMSYVFPPHGTVMMKKSLLYIPIFNVTSWLCNVIFVDRFHKERAQVAIEQCIQALTNKNLKLWVFPEGTRNRSLSGLLPFKKGAFNIAVKAQIPIVPVVASSYKSFYSKTEKYFESDGEIIVEFMDPISTEGLNASEVVELSEVVREKMLQTYERITTEVNERMRKKREAGKADKND